MYGTYDAQAIGKLYLIIEKKIILILDVSKHRNKYNRYKGGGVGGGGYR